MIEHCESHIAGNGLHYHHSKHTGLREEDDVDKDLEENDTPVHLGTHASVRR